MDQPSVLFEDQDFIVLDKPAGWFSIPGRDPGSEVPVLSSWLARHLNLGAEPTNPFIVHRLDRFTSGVILFAKNTESHKKANAWFLKREVKKVYHFLASPPPSRPAVQVRTAIEGKPAQTLFEVIRKNEIVFYGKATPLTGRFHQIREHAQEAGFPLLGDKPYGGLKEIKVKGHFFSFPHFCLHAQELTLPFGTFQAPLPQDLKTLIEEIL